MKKLENYGVQKLNAKEIKGTNGGFFSIFYWVEMWGGVNTSSINNYGSIDWATWRSPEYQT